MGGGTLGGGGLCSDGVAVPLAVICCIEELQLLPGVLDYCPRQRGVKEPCLALSDVAGCSVRPPSDTAIEGFLTGFTETFVGVAAWPAWQAYGAGWFAHAIATSTKDATSQDLTRVVGSPV